MKIGDPSNTIKIGEYEIRKDGDQYWIQLDMGEGFHASKAQLEKPIVKLIDKLVVKFAGTIK